MFRVKKMTKRLGITRGNSFYNWVLALGFAVSVVWILLVPTKPFSDFQYYNRLAAQIAKGGQWGDTYTAVGYSIFLAPFYWLLGASIWVAKGLNLILSTINNILVLLILKKVRICETLRKEIFILFVLFPMNIYYNSILANEILFTTLLLLGTFIFLTDNKFKYLIIGVITGLNSMIKPFFPIFALAIILTDLISEKKFLDSIKNGTVVILMTLVILSPWFYRNYLLIGQFTYISNNAGIVLYINNNSRNKAGGWMPAQDVDNSLVNSPDYLTANPTQRNIMLSSAAKEWIWSHPGQFVRLGLKRFSRTFIQKGDIHYAFYGCRASSLVKANLTFYTELVRLPIFIVGIVSIIGYAIIYLYQILGNRLPQKKARLALCLSVDKGSLLLIITFYMFAAVYFITEGQSRYAFPTVLSLTFYAVMGIESVKKMRG